jgi:hypothetical protein
MSNLKALCVYLDMLMAEIKVMPSDTCARLIRDAEFDIIGEMFRTQKGV